VGRLGFRFAPFPGRPRNRKGADMQSELHRQGVREETMARSVAEHEEKTSFLYAASPTERRDYLRTSGGALYPAARAWHAKHRALKFGVHVGDKRAMAFIYRCACVDKNVRCYLCGGMIPLGDRHVDHVIPLSKGGAHTASNLAITHSACNLRKSARIIERSGKMI